MNSNTGVGGGMLEFKVLHPKRERIVFRTGQAFIFSKRLTSQGLRCK